MTHISHEWSEDGQCAIEVHDDLPNWKFSLWDVAGIAFGTIGGVLISIGTGLGYLNRECQAAANFSRSEFDAARARHEEAEARADMAGTLEGMFLFDDPGYQPIVTEDDQ